jgi:hypothetical protein
MAVGIGPLPQLRKFSGMLLQRVSAKLSLNVEVFLNDPGSFSYRSDPGI